MDSVTQNPAYVAITEAIAKAPSQVTVQPGLYFSTGWGHLYEQLDKQERAVGMCLVGLGSFCYVAEMASSPVLAYDVAHSLANTEHFAIPGDGTIGMNDYYTTEDGESFEPEITIHRAAAEQFGITEDQMRTIEAGFEAGPRFEIRAQPVGEVGDCDLDGWASADGETVRVRIPLDQVRYDHDNPEDTLLYKIGMQIYRDLIDAA